MKKIVSSLIFALGTASVFEIGAFVVVPPEQMKQENAQEVLHSNNDFGMEGVELEHVSIDKLLDNCLEIHRQNYKSPSMFEVLDGVQKFCYNIRSINRQALINDLEKADLSAASEESLRWVLIKLRDQLVRTARIREAQQYIGQEALRILKDSTKTDEQVRNEIYKLVNNAVGTSIDSDRFPLNFLSY